MPYKLPTHGRIVLEGLVVGILLVKVFALIHLAFMAVFNKKAMTSHGLLAIQIVLTGMITHIAFEATGWNKKFCAMLRDMK